MNSAKRRLGLAVALVMMGVVMAASGCSSPGPGPDTGFWDSLQLGVLEEDPPTSVEDLANRAVLIVAGTIVGIEQGPSLKTDDVVGFIMPTAALTVRTTTQLKGTHVGREIIVVVTVPRAVDAETHPRPSGNQTLFFLEPFQDGYYVCVAIAGLIEETQQGLVTVMDRRQSTIVGKGPGNRIKSFDDLVAEVRSYVS